MKVADEATMVEVEYRDVPWVELAQKFDTNREYTNWFMRDVVCRVWQHGELVDIDKITQTNQLYITRLVMEGFSGNLISGSPLT